MTDMRYFRIMKWKFISAILACFFCCFAFAQERNPENPVKSDVAQRSADSLEIVNFNMLVDFLNADSLHIRITEDSSLRHFGEQHVLSIPVNAAGTYPPMTHFSWDNTIPSVYHKEPLKGSPFFLSSYTRGLVISPKGKVLDRADYFYNYDKGTGNLLLKKNNDLPIAVYRDQVKMFCLKLEKGGYIFERVGDINPNEYLQVLNKGKNYSLYKLIKIKFVEGRYNTDGYTETGHPYDEYQDVVEYYLMDEQKKEFSVIEVSRKSVKRALAEKSVYVDLYLKEHKSVNMEEPNLIGLIDYLNK